MRAKKRALHLFYIVTVVIICALGLILKLNNENRTINEKINAGYELTEQEKKPKMIRLTASSAISIAAERRRSWVSIVPYPSGT